MVKNVTNILLSIVCSVLAVIVGINIFLNLHHSHNKMAAVSEDYFIQVEALIQANKERLEGALDTFTASTLRNARTASYAIENNKKLQIDLNEIKELAQIMNLEEIHIFDQTGKIIFGTHPEYYGYAFESGEQMQFFLPMLSDKSLEMCQGIKPNTAEGKMMQYAAVWRSDGNGIVEVGINPKEVLNIESENDLNHVVSKIPSERDEELYIISAQDGTVIADTTDDNDILSADSLGIQWQNAGEKMQRNPAVINGKRNCVYYQRYNDLIYARAYPSASIVTDVFFDTFVIIIYFIIIFLIGTIHIRNYICKKIINVISDINSDMNSMEYGIKTYVGVDTEISELNQLQKQINNMADSIRRVFENYTIALQVSNLSIGVYDWNVKSKRFFISEQVWGILKITQTDNTDKNTEMLHSRIREMDKNVFDKQKHIYTFVDNETLYYIHVEEISRGDNKIYLFLDVTDEYREKEQIRQERDRDYLTGLYTRRAFMQKLKQLFLHENQLGYAAVIMIDADGLKTVNDNNGHHIGDKYLIDIAEEITRDLNCKCVGSHLSGDEFALFIYGFETEQQLMDKIADIKQRDGKKNMPINSNAKILLRFSLGYAVYGKDSEDFHELLKFADERMYAEKIEKKTKR